MGLLPGSKYTDTLPDPVQGAGSFICNGAGAVTRVAGMVLRVRRLVDGSARPFFRCTLDAKTIELDKLSTIITASARGTAITSEPLATLPTTTLVAVPADVKATNEIDVVLLSAGVPADTAGFRIDLHIAAARGRTVSAS